MSTSTHPSGTVDDIARMQSELRTLRDTVQRVQDHLNVQEDMYRAIGLKFHRLVPLSSRMDEEDGSPSANFISSEFYFPAYWKKMMELTTEAYKATYSSPETEKLRADLETARKRVNEVGQRCNAMFSQIQTLRQNVDILVGEVGLENTWFAPLDYQEIWDVYLGRRGTRVQRTQMLVFMQSKPEWAEFESWIKLDTFHQSNISPVLNWPFMCDCLPLFYPTSAYGNGGEGKRVASQSGVKPQETMNSGPKLGK
ncbi:uncharacterized protein EI97DRAFT_482632 [Westerdykella ornata]|uniref:Uncharacterized protein n=1 Tax=Westerdykella ornata TaxID=318751 RepID=A0A6A6JT88_WESOR|nr:uncharacterized protein EI97DRAFT_482632 [Westerdykella ornata]KAF2279830.1 hypothetical protein EI97DRAFT_482632 [Westerdykella ornata]